MVFCPMVYTRIRKICKAKEMTIAELCRIADVKREAMREWDEHIPAADKLYSVADALGTTVGYLLTGES